MTVPGIGRIIASAMVATIGDRPSVAAATSVLGLA
jgi:hypothetical protein